jgi:hypothetical protein
MSAIVSWIAVSALPARELSFDDRVAAQKAIEQVYWNHRLWPKENPGPKPQLAAVMPDAMIRAKVEDYLKKSNALERWWQRPVTAEQLQAELDRVAKDTRDGAMLRELFRALGNDPFLIAETLGRQTLVERLIQNWYASDTRFHGALKKKAEAALSACASVDCMKALGGDYRETTWKRRGHSSGARAIAEGMPILLEADEWTDRVARLARTLGSSGDSLPTGRLSTVVETADAFVVTAVLEQREGAVTMASVALAATVIRRLVEVGAARYRIRSHAGSRDVLASKRSIDDLHERHMERDEDGCGRSTDRFHSGLDRIGIDRLGRLEHHRILEHRWTLQSIHGFVDADLVGQCADPPSTPHRGVEWNGDDCLGRVHARRVQ